MNCFELKRIAFLSKPGFVFSVGLFAVIGAFGFSTASAQASLRKAVYEKSTVAPVRKAPEPKKAAPPKRTPPRVSTVVRKPAPAPKKKTSAKAVPSRRPASRPGWVKVAFESVEPNTQVYLNGNLVGTTDKNRVFQRTMTPGIYRIRGVHGMDVVFAEKLVQIGSNGMKIALREEVAEKPPPTTNELPLVIPKTPAEIEMDLAREMSAKVIRIFSDYLDPQKSAEVTTDDWRFAANAAVLGEFQNLSRQQIEAQRKFAAGQVALADKSPQKALNNFRLAIQSFSGSPLPHIGLGDTYMNSAQWQDARRSYEQAKSVGPNFWMVHRRLGDIYRLIGEKKKALSAYADAVKFGDNRYETRFLRARALVDAGDAVAATPLLEELLKEKVSPEAHLALGEAYEMMKRDVAALDNYRKAVDLDPDSAVAQYKLARIYYEQREYRKALDGFDAALKLDGERKSFSHEDAREKRNSAQAKVRSVSK